jgi:hypothetical protein
VLDDNSSIDSDEFDQETRDRVKAEFAAKGSKYDSSSDEGDEGFTNTDLKYYDIMDMMEK